MLRNSDHADFLSVKSRTTCCDKKARVGGFTLIEILIALSLAAILATSLYSVYFTLVRGKESALAGMENRRELRVTLDTIRRELDSTFYNRTNRQLHFVVEDRDIFGKPASSLEFTTLTPPHAGTFPVSDLSIVRYQPVEKDDHIILGKQSRDLFFSVDPAKYPQMENLDAFLVECYDGSQWVKTWDTGINMRLPQAVRVSVRVMEGEKPVTFFTTAIPKVSGN